MLAGVTLYADYPTQVMGLIVGVIGLPSSGLRMRYLPSGRNRVSHSSSRQTPGSPLKNRSVVCRSYVERILAEGWWPTP